MNKTSKNGSSTGVERRRMRRRPILSTFAVFIVIPKKGTHRLAVHDLSEMGMAFDVDIEGESPSDFSIAEGDSIDYRFYLNNSLYIPLTIQVKRVEQQADKRSVGAEFQDLESESYKAFLCFLQLLDKMVEVAQIDPAVS